MSATRPVTISKTVSRPINPDASSFLTTIPPEIRNRIYELLFYRDIPVLLHDRKAYLKRCLARIASAIRNSCGEDCGRWYPGYNRWNWNDVRDLDVEQYVEDSEFRHGFEATISLIHTCRQVYHEGAGVLYGTNRFCFSSVPPEDIGTYYHHEYALKWLSHIGSQFTLLAKEMDLLPYLKLIWARLDTRYELAFTQDDHSMRLSYQYAHYTSEDHTDLSAPVLNNLLITLGRNDALSIKRFAKFKTLLSGVHVKSGYRCLETFITRRDPNPRDWDNDDTTRFETSHDGKIAQWLQRSPDKNCGLQLPQSVRTLIYEYACTSDSTTVFDLDLNIAYGLPMNMHHLSSQIRWGCMYFDFWRNHHVRLEMTSEFMCTNFNNFASLQQWASLCVFYRMFDKIAAKGGAEISLNFTNSKQTTLQDFRTDIKMLLLRLQLLNNRCSLKFARKFVKGSHETCSEEVRVSWGFIQRAVFLLLSDVLQELPHRASCPLPQIWIDGLGNMLGVLFPADSERASEVIGYRYASLDDSQKYQIGADKIQSFTLAGEAGKGVPIGTRSDPGPSFFPNDPYQDRIVDSVEHTWYALRDSLWE